MKVTITKKPEVAKDRYPMLMVADDGVVILAVCRDGGCVTGTRLNKNNTGEHSRVWAIDAFTPFHGTITLQND